MEIFKEVGLSGAFRMAHIFAAIMWMGLLWFFNFVQTPAFAEMDPAARNNALDKLTWRALWWFRWAAAATVLFGLLIIMVGKTGLIDLHSGTFWFKSAPGVTLLSGIIMGVIMFLNVWLVIWPNQQIVIANARNVQAGGEADPNAAAAGRAGAMASRQNTIFSFPLLVFMIGVSHFYTLFDNSGPHFAFDSSKCLLFLLIAIVIIAVLELNALGMISGRGNTGLNWMYETHKNAIITGSGLIVFFYLLSEIIIRR